MKTSASQTYFLAMVLASAIEFTLASVSTSCNPGILKLYGWCEQWACAQNCTCVERQDCHQYCDGQTCRDMRCLSQKICKQKVHLNGEVRPHVLHMFARASLVTQDCQGGTCDVMRAKGPRLSKRPRSQRKRSGRRKDGRRSSRAVVGGEEQETSYGALQNCIGGVCKRLVSTLKISKQFCSHCDKVHCFGASATNCTQICASGNCKVMQCDSKHCEQACLQNSNCNLRCGRNVETCLQVCELGSTCQMSCDAESCKQVCGANKECRVLKGSPQTHNSTKTTVMVSTQSTTKTTYYSNTEDIYKISKQPSTTFFTEKTTRTATEEPATPTTTKSPTTSTTNPITASTTNSITASTEGTSTYFSELLQSTLGNEKQDYPTTTPNEETDRAVSVQNYSEGSVTDRNRSAAELHTLDLRLFRTISILVCLLLILR